MNTRKLELSKIEFESSYQEVKLFGEFHEGNLHYSSELIVNQKQLNCIINLLYSNNESFDLQDRLQGIEFEPDCFIYSVTVNDLENKTIDLSTLEPYNSIVQICA